MACCIAQAGISRPESADDWEGGRFLLPPSGPIHLLSGRRQEGPPISSGDEVWIWTHEDRNHGAGRGMTARGIAATAAEPISTSGVDFLAVQLAPIELLVRPFGFQELKDGQPLPRALQFLDRRRHHEAYYIDASDHQELLEFEEAWRVKKEKMIAEAEARRADRQHPGHHASETADRNSPWIRDELILALDLYVRHAGNPPGKTSQDISELSALLNRLGDVTGRTHRRHIGTQTAST